MTFYSQSSVELKPNINLPFVLVVAGLRRTIVCEEGDFVAFPILFLSSLVFSCSVRLPGTLSTGNHDWNLCASLILHIKRIRNSTLGKLLFGIRYCILKLSSSNSAIKVDLLAGR